MYPKIMDKLERASKVVTAGADIVRYQQDIIVFLRLSRAVAGGISVRSNIQFKTLSKYVEIGTCPLCYANE